MMKITPLDIRQQQFKIRFRGFDVHEVDTFLEAIADTVHSLIAENNQLKEKIGRLELESEGYKKREETFKRVMLNSQKVLDEMKANARKSADLVIAEAEVKAERILNGAHDRLAQLHEDISELKRQRLQIELQIRSVIESHTKLLDLGNENAKSIDDAEAKVKLFKNSKGAFS
jgi:cell division initiation protein